MTLSLANAKEISANAAVFSQLEFYMEKNALEGFLGGKDFLPLARVLPPQGDDAQLMTPLRPIESLQLLQTG